MVKTRFFPGRFVQRTATPTPTPTPTPSAVAPVNSTLPAITGSPVKGQTLSCSTGAWLNSPTSFAFQWYTGASPIALAVASTYALTASEVGATITCRVTASNTAGGASATSTGAGPVIDLAPVNTVVPAITGTPTVGQVLSVSNGTWANTPTSYAYQWKLNGASIVGATSSSYTLTSGENGGTITCVVTAVNSGGSTNATSNSVGPVGSAGAAPNNTVAPALSGSAIVGQTLYTSNGTWDITPSSYTYQWFRDGSAISGETSDNYTLADADETSVFKCQVTAYNVAAPSSPANSNNSAAVAGIDLSTQAPVNTRTTSSGAIPFAWDTAFGDKTFTGYLVRLQEGADSGFATVVQEVTHFLTSADLVAGATIDWASEGWVALSDANHYIRSRIETHTPSGVYKESGWSSVISPTDHTGHAVWDNLDGGFDTAKWQAGNITPVGKGTDSNVTVLASGGAMVVHNAASGGNPCTNAFAGKKTTNTAVFADGKFFGLQIVQDMSASNGLIYFQFDTGDGDDNGYLVQIAGGSIHLHGFNAGTETDRGGTSWTPGTYDRLKLQRETNDMVVYGALPSAPVVPASGDWVELIRFAFMGWGEYDGTSPVYWYAGAGAWLASSALSDIIFDDFNTNMGL